MTAPRRLIAWLLLWLVCGLVAMWCWLAMPASAAFGSGRRGLRLAVGFDQLGNIAAGGDEDEVFSARCWRLRHESPYSFLQPGIDRAFYWAFSETGHCENAYFGELKKRKGAYAGKRPDDV